MKKRKALPHLFLFLFVLIFFYPVILGKVPFPGDMLVGYFAPYNTQSYNGFAPGAVPHKAQGPDVIRELMPWKNFVITSFLNGQIPFWNPYEFSGNPLLANFQSGAFYPLNIVFFPLGFLSGWTLFIFLIPLLSALFLYLYLREVDVGEAASVFGGIVFAFSSYMVVWMEYGNIGHTLLWLPFILYCTEKLLKKFEKKWVVALLLALFFSFLAGYIQGYFYIVGTTIFYYLGRKIAAKQFSPRPAIYFLFIVLIPLGFGLFQLLPTLQLFSLSTRGNYTLSQIQHLLNPFWYMVTVAVPDFFGNPATRNSWFYGTYIERVSYFGFIPFLLALYALFSQQKKIYVRLFSILFILSFLLTTDIFVTKYFYLIPVPVLSTTVPTRLLCLFVFSGSILAGFGFDMFLKRQKKKSLLVTVLLGLLFFFCLWSLVLFGPRILHADWVANLSIARHNLLLPTGYFCGFIILAGILFFISVKKQPILQRVVILGIFAITLFDLFYFFHKITPFAPKTYYYPPTAVKTYLQEQGGINRFWGYGSGYLYSNFNTIDHTYSPEGNDPLHLASYTELLEASKNGTTTQPLSRMDANIAPGYGTGDLNSNRNRQKILNLLGVRYILNKNETITKDMNPDTGTFDPKTYQLVWQETPWQIYENREAAPRAFLTTDYQVIDEKDFIKSFYASDFNERQTLLLSSDPHLSHATLTQKKAEIVTYRPNSVLIRTTTNAPALLFLSDNNYPGWKATVDDKQIQILTADYSFRAVVVPAGEHLVTFYYQDDAFLLGLVTSLFGMLITVFIVKRISYKNL